MKEPIKKLIVISGVNLFSGGTLTILQECLQFLENDKNITDSYSILALVHKKELFPSFKNIEAEAHPKPRGNWLWKLYYEYVYFKKLSKKKEVYLWFSLYDMSPSVKAERRAVYCHNPAPFYRTNRMERHFDKGFFLFTLFYKYLYSINIKKNNYVVVQQNWIRKQFTEMFRLSANRIIVAHPQIVTKSTTIFANTSHTKNIFLYPALPRVFKNFEVIIIAVTLAKQHTDIPFEIILTISGDENKYAKYIRSLAVHLPEIKCMGLQSKTAMISWYETASCLLFPSKLETWGLPVTEAKAYKLPMLVADMPYAKETVGDYNAVSFFKQDDAIALANLMVRFLQNTLTFDGNRLIKPPEPFSESWQETFDRLLA